MNEEEMQVQPTQHAFWVAWGWFGEHIGLIQALQKVHLHQKRYTHTQHTKVLEFLVANLLGAKHLQDISQLVHPLDLDAAVAWGQASCWADYSGVSRTLSGLSWEEVHAVVKVLDEIAQSFLQATKLTLLRKDGKRLQYDGDLTGIPVSNTSETYPNATYGHMDDEIRLGY